MRRINWELMRPQDIEIRTAQVKDGKATLLLYQDARNTMDALDRNFGEFGWKMEYKDVGGQIYGRLSILNPDTGEWIYKEDTGDESNISAQKGQSSDILKRCIVRFGYGRELYTAPRIIVPDDGYGNKYRVGEISYNQNREITHLTLINALGKVVFQWPSVSQPTQVKTKEEVLKEFCAGKKATEPREKLLAFFVFYKAKTWSGVFDLSTAERLYSKWGTRGN